MFWFVIAAGWGIVVLAVIGIASIPGKNLDIYVRDRYFVCSKTTLAVTVTLILILPLLIATIRRLRLPHR